MNAQTGKELIASLVEGVQFVPPLHISLAGCSLEIRCSSDLIRQQLADYCTPFVVEESAADIIIIAHEQPVVNIQLPMQDHQPEPGKTSVKEAWAELDDVRIVRKLKTGMLMLFDRVNNLVIGPCRANPNQVINFINNRFIEWKLNQGALLGHASALTLNNTGMAIAGFSGMGKSTLALHLMHDGADFVSNDRLLIEANDSGLQMTGVAKWPRINPGTALHNPSLFNVLSEEEKKRFSALPERDLWELEHKYDVLIEECFGPERFRLQASMDRLCLLNWQRGEKAMQVEETDVIKRPDLLPALMKDTGLFYLPKDGQPKNHSQEEYQEVLRACPVLALSGGINFQEATRIICDWLR